MKLGNSIFCFDAHHQIPNITMSIIAQSTDNFVANGPWDMTSALDRYRETNGINYKIIDQRNVFPIPYERWGEFFSPANDTTMLDDCLVVHWWNNMLTVPFSDAVHKGDLIYRLMEKHCPVVVPLLNNKNYDNKTL